MDIAKKITISITHSDLLDMIRTVCPDTLMVPHDVADVMTGIETLDQILMPPVSGPFTITIEYTVTHKG